MKPLIIINFKSYKEAQGAKAVKLAEECAAAGGKADVIVVPALHDLAMVSNSVKIRVFSPHIDIAEHGAYTGHVTAAGLCAAGVRGALVNHSERAVSRKHVVEAVDVCKRYGLVSVVCAPTLKAVKNVLKDCEPDFIAYEPPELIGGDVSVTSASQDIIKSAAVMVKKSGRRTKLLCGAGVKTGEDVSVALRLGAVGVLVASGVVKAKKPADAVRNLVSGTDKSI